MIWTKSKDKTEIILLSFLILFATLSLLSFIVFVVYNKTVKITEENIIITYLLLPIRNKISLSEIVSISQKSEEVYAMLPGDSFSNLSFLYTSTTVTLRLLDDKKIKLHCIGKSDYEQFNKAFLKTKHNVGKIKKNRLSILDYIGDNIDGIFWILLCLILIIGLGHELLTT